METLLHTTWGALDKEDDHQIFQNHRLSEKATPIPDERSSKQREGAVALTSKTPNILEPMATTI